MAEAMGTRWCLREVSRRWGGSLACLLVPSPPPDPSAPSMLEASVHGGTPPSLLGSGAGGGVGVVRRV